MINARNSSAAPRRDESRGFPNSLGGWLDIRIAWYRKWHLYGHTRLWVIASLLPLLTVLPQASYSQARRDTASSATVRSRELLGVPVRPGGTKLSPRPTQGGSGTAPQAASDTGGTSRALPRLLGRPVPPDKDPVSRDSAANDTTALARATSSSREVTTRREGNRINGEIRLNSVFFGNFFQAPDGSPQQSVRAGSGEFYVSRNLNRLPQLRPYAWGNLVGYDALEPSGGMTGGVRWENTPHAVDIAAGYQLHSPRFDVGDEFDHANAVDLGGEYSYRAHRNVEITAASGYRRESYSRDSRKDSQGYELEGALRYRGFGRRFSPEVGIGRSRTDAVVDDEDHRERALRVQLRAVPMSSLSLSARYQYRIRNYVAQDSSSRNFEREDQRHQAAAGADIRTGRNWSLNFRYTYQDANSSRQRRAFTSQTLSAGLSFRFN
jgi:opacity protein-like surface antigen